MTSRRVNNPNPPATKRRPAATLDARENQLIDAAVTLAERQLSEGTASAQVITHYLKLGSTREQLEQKRLAMEVELMEAKRQQIASAEKMEELYVVAIHAMRSYKGDEPLELEGGDLDDDDY